MPPTGVPDARPGPTSGDDPAALLERHAQAFRDRYGAEGPIRRFFSPGRVNLMGAHLDYNGGPVMPMALDRGTFLAVRPRSDGVLRLASTLEQETFTGSVDAMPGGPAGRWYDYPLGVIQFVLAREERAIGADVLFGGNLPIGAGLSSSASICVGTAFALRALLELSPDPGACIDAALWGEREWVGVQCGIMDPFAVALSRPGSLLWIDCKAVRTEHLPYDAESLRVAVIDTGIRRALAQGEFNRRVSECQEAFRMLQARGAPGSVLCEVPLASVEEWAEALGPVLARRARHVVTETERAYRARRALEQGDLPGFASGLWATHESLRDLYEVSVPELDCIVESAHEVPGVHGARLTGAGFGGCAVVLHSPEVGEDLDRRIAENFERRFGRRPTVFFFRAGAGPREF